MQNPFEFIFLYNTYIGIWNNSSGIEFIDLIFWYIIDVISPHDVLTLFYRERLENKQKIISCDLMNCVRMKLLFKKI